MRRQIFLVVVLLTSPTWSLRSQDITLPVKSGSVRFAAIGDMGSGDKAQYDIAQRMVGYRAKFPFDFADSEGCRSAFRTDVDHDSEVMPISVPN